MFVTVNNNHHLLRQKTAKYDKKFTRKHTRTQNNVSVTRGKVCTSQVQWTVCTALLCVSLSSSLLNICLN